MRKRENPLEVKKEESQFNKRENPLSLGNEVEVELPNLKMSDVPNLKRRFVFTKVSKDLINEFKTLYPDVKLNQMLEYAMLSHLLSLDREKYESMFAPYTQEGENE